MRIAGVFTGLALFFVCPCFAQTNQTYSLSIATYYPSPSGVYRNLRLFPTTQPSFPIPPQAGTLFFNQTDNNVYVYKILTGKWETVGGTGVWVQNGANINNTNTGNVGINVAVPSEKLEVGGNIKAVGFYYSSDRALKTDIRPLDNSLAMVSRLEGVSFRWKHNGRADIGLAAQDVEKVYPELVSTDPQSGLKSVEYGNLVAALIESVKEQQKQISQLRSEVDELKRKR